MSGTGQSLYESLLGTPKTQKGKCKSCGSSLELYELDIKHSAKVLRCQRCSMLHFYRKDILGKWKLQKAQKPDVSPTR